MSFQPVPCLQSGRCRRQRTRGYQRRRIPPPEGRVPWLVPEVTSLERSARAEGTAVAQARSRRRNRPQERLMQLEEHVRDAISGELKRQAETSGGKLKVTPGENSAVEVQGTINIDDLVMAITGSLAGGP